MAASLNQVNLIGNLCRDVEVRYIASGTAVCDISLAVNDRVKKNNEWVDEVTFVDVTLWGKQAEIAGEYLGKGSSVLIVGKLKLDTWEKDGQKRSKLKVTADRMQMIGGKRGDFDQSRDDSQDYSQAPPQREAAPVTTEEETPF